MRITEEQMALIRSLRCERLASNEENLRLMILSIALETTMLRMLC